MPDQVFEHPRLVAVYDALDPDRSDLEVYVAMADELGARSVLDVGCGTGVLATMLAATGREVAGVDPAPASLAWARARPGAGPVRWLDGDATGLPPLQVDLATMTGNVAQAVVEETDWAATLRGVHAALRPGGHLVLETRDPARRGWLEWNRADSHRVHDLPGVGVVETWVELTEVDLPLVSFRSSWVFASDGALLASDSTLRFRERAEVEASLAEAGFALREVRDAPDRPGRELVFLAERASRPGSAA